MKLNAEITINTSAQSAWQTLGEHFGDISLWASPIVASSLEGAPIANAVRTCHIAGFGPVKPGTIKEQLLSFEPEIMSLSYQSIEGMPSFITKATNRWSVRPLDSSRCIVSTHATLELQGIARLFGFLLKWRMMQSGASVLDELRYYLEQQRPHPRKVRAMPNA